MHCGGLYDYLEDRLAFTLTRRLLQHVAPGGRLILANFAPWTRGGVNGVHTGAGRDGRLLGESDLPAIARLFVRLGGRVVVAAQCQSSFRRHYAAFVWCLDEFAKVLINLLEHLRDFGVRLDS